MAHPARKPRVKWLLRIEALFEETGKPFGTEKLYDSYLAACNAALYTKLKNVTRIILEKVETQ